MLGRPSRFMPNSFRRACGPPRCRWLQHSVVLVGGFAPLIVTWLIAATGSPIAPAIYVIGAAAVSGAALLGLRDRFREPCAEFPT